MAVFISYSHADKDFVDKLAAHLVRHRARIWLDRWELKVGDSLIGRVEDAIQDSDALIVVLSNASIASEWCRKELKSGLLRELEEKRVVVLPVIVDDCTVPLFLREKKYADFRKGFDAALEEVLTAIASAMSDTMGRSRRGGVEADWAFDCEVHDEEVRAEVVLAERTEGLPCTVLTMVSIRSVGPLAERMRLYAAKGIEWFGRQLLLENARHALESMHYPPIIISDEHPVLRRFGLEDERRDLLIEFTVTARRLGEDTGRDILVDLIGQFELLLGAMRRATGEPAPADLEAMASVLGTWRAKEPRAAKTAIPKKSKIAKKTVKGHRPK